MQVSIVETAETRLVKKVSGKNEGVYAFETTVGDRFGATQPARGRAKVNEFQEIRGKIKQKLTPDSIKRTLTLSALYITTYEFLKRTIIDCVDHVNFLDFDTSGFLFGGKLTPQIRKEYEIFGISLKGDEEDLKKAIKVRYEHNYKERYQNYKRAYQKSEDRECLDSEMGMACLWLVDNKVISEGEIEDVERITKHRNKIAHDLPNFLITWDLEVNLDYLNRIVELFSKIDRWQTELERETEPDPEIREKEWHSGRSLLLYRILSTALSD